MPSSISCQTKVWVEPLPSLQVLLEGAAECDLALLPRWGSDSRKREALAWHRIVRRELGVDAELSYNEVGAPVILNKKGYISVSHNAEYVAVAYSETSPCAIDIESEDRNFHPLSSRYLKPEERSLSSHPAWLCIAWSAKETLYKLAARRGLNLQRDISLNGVEKFDSHRPATNSDLEPQGSITASVNNSTYTLLYAQAGSSWVVWH